MADSQTIDWLNENALRAYPLNERILRTSGDYRLTNDVILDAQFVYNTLPDTTALTQIVVDSTNVVFTINGVTFTVSRTGDFPVYIRKPSGSLLVVGVGATNIPEGSYTFSNVTFEPSVSFEFGGAWLGVQSMQFDSGSVLTGSINFVEGWQFGINITGTNITLSCGSAYGVPIGCTSFGNYPDDCNTIVSYINGLSEDGNGILHIVGDGEIIVLDDPDNHRIFVGLSNNPATDKCPAIQINPAQLTV